MSLPGLFSILGLLLWVAYELLLRRREDADAADWHADGADRGSTVLLLACYLLVVLVTVGLSTTSVTPVPTAGRWLGVVLIAAGLGLRAWGMRTLGRFYTRTLRTSADQHVVRRGPYRLIRHPGYCGSLLVWTGYPLGLGSWLAVLLAAGLLFAAYHRRIEAEESLLLHSFGGEYAEYRQRTKRLLPFLY
ncbi:methyltransferase family protein [Kitasatospora sp. NPDC052896]|uniref:methyltransferase family protein n=1 Tax=Kitasatospora sp. NPDC052896 TaxID=3364061 RepID=UPI0037C84DB8